MGKSPVLLTRFWDFLFEAWWIDWIVVALAVFLCIMYVPVESPFDILYPLGEQARRESYSDLLTVAALFAGFTSVAFTAYLGWRSQGIRTLQAKAGRRLNTVWLSLIAGPWIAAILVWVVRVVDSGEPPTSPVRWLALGALLLVLLSVVRCLWVFLELLKTEEKSERNPTQGVSTHSFKKKS